MDARIEFIFREATHGDTSFIEKPSFLELIFGRDKYTPQEMRDTWHRGIKHGIEIGLIKAGLDGQRIELLNNTTDIKHSEFIEKLYELCDEYGCYIQYHPLLGMTIISKRE